MEVFSAHNESNDRLLDRYLRLRDEAAFAELVRRFGPMVLGVSRRLLSFHEDADDATQLVFAELARRAGTIEDPAFLGSWLHTITVRVAYRLRRRRPKSEPLATDPVDPRLTLDDVGRRSDLEILSEELDKLPASWREPLVLRYFAGLSNAEGAAQLGTTQKAYEGRLKRGRNSLRVRLLRRGVGSAAVLAMVGPAVMPVQADHWEAVTDAASELAVDPTALTFFPPEPTTIATPLLTYKTAVATGVAAVVLTMLGGSGTGIEPGKAFSPVSTVVAEESNPAVSPQPQADVGIQVGPSPNDRFHSASPKVRAALESKITLELFDQPLYEVVRFLSELSRVPIQLDEQEIKRVGVTPSAEVNYIRSQVPLHDALLGILGQFKQLTFDVRDEAIVVTSEEAVASTTQIRRPLYEIVKDRPRSDARDVKGGPATVHLKGIPDSMLKPFLDGGDPDQVWQDFVNEVNDQVDHPEGSFVVLEEVDETGRPTLTIQSFSDFGSLILGELIARTAGIPYASVTSPVDSASSPPLTQPTPGRRAISNEMLQKIEGRTGKPVPDWAKPVLFGDSPPPSTNQLELAEPALAAAAKASQKVSTPSEDAYVRDSYNLDGIFPDYQKVPESERWQSIVNDINREVLAKRNAGIRFGGIDGNGNIDIDIPRNIPGLRALVQYEILNRQFDIVKAEAAKYSAKLDQLGRERFSPAARQAALSEFRYSEIDIPVWINQRLDEIGEPYQESANDEATTSKNALLANASPHALEMLFFRAPWEPVSRRMDSTIDTIQERFQDELSITEVSADDNRSLLQKYNVTALPTFVIRVNETAIDRLVGFQSQEQLASRIQQAILAANNDSFSKPVKTVIAYQIAELPLHNDNGETTAQVIGRLLGNDATVAWHEKNNSLIVRATEEQHRALAGLFQHMRRIVSDSTPKQNAPFTLPHSGFEGVAAPIPANSTQSSIPQTPLNPDTAPEIANQELPSDVADVEFNVEPAVTKSYKLDDALTDPADVSRLVESLTALQNGGLQIKQMKGTRSIVALGSKKQQQALESLLKLARNGHSSLEQSSISAATEPSPANNSPLAEDSQPSASKPNSSHYMVAVGVHGFEDALFSDNGNKPRDLQAYKKRWQQLVEEANTKLFRPHGTTIRIHNVADDGDVNLEIPQSTAGADALFVRFLYEKKLRVELDALREFQDQFARVIDSTDYKAIADNDYRDVQEWIRERLTAPVTNPFAANRSSEEPTVADERAVKINARTLRMVADGKEVLVTTDGNGRLRISTKPIDENDLATPTPIYQPAAKPSTTTAPNVAQPAPAKPTIDELAEMRGAILEEYLTAVANITLFTRKMADGDETMKVEEQVEAYGELRLLLETVDFNLDLIESKNVVSPEWTKKMRTGLTDLEEKLEALRERIENPEQPISVPTPTSTPIQLSPTKDASSQIKYPIDLSPHTDPAISKRQEALKDLLKLLQTQEGQQDKSGDSTSLETSDEAATEVESVPEKPTMFEESTPEEPQTPTASLIYLYHPNRGPSDQMLPVVKAFAAEHADAIQLTIGNVEEDRSLYDLYGFKSVPTTVLVREGQIVGRHTGAMSADDLKSWLEPYKANSDGEEEDQPAE